VFYPVASLAQGLTRELQNPAHALRGPGAGGQWGCHRQLQTRPCCQYAAVMVERWLSHNKAGGLHPLVR